MSGTMLTRGSVTRRHSIRINTGDMGTEFIVPAFARQILYWACETMYKVVQHVAGKIDDLVPICFKGTSKATQASSVAYKNGPYG
jgi:hypothetical protein